MGTSGFQSSRVWAQAQRRRYSQQTPSLLPRDAPRRLGVNPPLLTRSSQGVQSRLQYQHRGPGATSRSAPRRTDPSEASHGPSPAAPAGHTAPLELHNLRASRPPSRDAVVPSPRSAPRPLPAAAPHSPALPPPLALGGSPQGSSRAATLQNTPHPAAHARPLDITPRSPPGSQAPSQPIGDEALMGMGKVQRTEGARRSPRSGPPHPTPSFPHSTVSASTVGR